jgi:hypothetical protein
VASTFIATFKRQLSVASPIASDTWTFRDANGRKRQARIEVGQPQPVPDDQNQDWFCPVFIEGWTPHVIPAMGVGPVDSLMNAATLLRSFHESIGNMQIAYGKSKARARRRASQPARGRKRLEPAE